MLVSEELATVVQLCAFASCDKYVSRLSLYSIQLRALFFLHNYFSVWGMLVGVITRGLQTLEEANEAEQFFADPEHPAGAGQRRLAQALEAVRTNAVRLHRDRNAVASFLDGVVVV